MTTPPGDPEPTKKQSLHPGPVTITQDGTSIEGHVNTLRMVEGHPASTYSFQGVVGLPDEKLRRAAIYKQITRQTREECLGLPEIDLEELHEEILTELARCDFEKLEVPFDRHAIADRVMRWIETHFDGIEGMGF